VQRFLFNADRILITRQGAFVMQLDVVKLISPDSAWWPANGLQMSPTPGGKSDHTMWTFLDAAKLVYMKGPSGYPWDWYEFLPDDDFIRIIMTENVWSNPATCKINYKTGCPRYPRYIDYSPDQQGQALKQFSLTPPRTDYMIINADGSANANSNGNVTCKFYGPIAGADILDSNGKVLIPAGNDWVSEYYRSGAMERLTHRAPVGRYMWQQYDSTGKLTQASYPVGIVAAVCPSPVQKIW
jgi:hypothetical protein